MLLRLEVDFGKTMAEDARQELSAGNTEEYVRLKEHATSALMSVAQHKHRAMDELLEQHYAELAALVAKL